MKKILLACLSAMLIAPAANAQFSFGPEAGFNLSNYSVSVPGYFQPTTVAVPGVRVGVIADYAFSSHLSLQPGAFYALNGIKYKYSLFGFGDLSVTAHINTINIPVNVIYKFGEEGHGKFFVGAGPFLGINLGGNAKLTANITNPFGTGFGTTTTSFDSTVDFTVGSASTDFIKRIDFGAGINAGYELTNGLLFRLGYSRGFLELTPNSANGSAKSVNYNVSVAYLIHSKKNKAAAKQPTGSQ